MSKLLSVSASKPSREPNLKRASLTRTLPDAQPYLFAGGGYRDPMMGASSMLSPSPGRSNYMEPYGSPDPMQVMPSTPAMYYPQQGGPVSFGMNELAAAESSAPLVELGPQSSGPAQFPSLNSAFPSQPRDYYVTYQPSKGQAKQAAASDLNGHYTPFYTNPGGQPQQGPLEPASSFQQASYDANPPYAQQPQREPAEAPQVQQLDQLVVPAAAPESPAMANYPRFAQSSAGTSRRSGAVTLKMNEATKARLQQQLQRQHSRRQVEQYLPTVFYPAKSGPEEAWLSEGAFTPLASEPSGDLVVRAGKAAPRSREAVPTAPSSLSQSEPSAIGQQWHASLAERAQQGQSMPKTGLTYMIIRPKKTTGFAKAPAEFEQAHPADQNEFGSAGRPGGAWRQANSWRSVEPSGRREPNFAPATADEQLQSAASSVNAQNERPQQVFGGARSRQSNGIAQEPPQASRLSRTGSAAAAAGQGAVKGVVRRPSESLTDYGMAERVVAEGSQTRPVATAKPPQETTGEANRPPGGRAASQAEQSITTLGGLHETAPSHDGAPSVAAATSVATASLANNSDDSRTNLIQLNESENDANNGANNVKPMEAINANSTAEPSGNQRAPLESAGEESALVNGDTEIDAAAAAVDHQRRQPSNHRQQHSADSEEPAAMKALLGVASLRPSDS